MMATQDPIYHVLPELEYNIGDDPPAEGEPGPISNFWIKKII